MRHSFFLETPKKIVATSHKKLTSSSSPTYLIVLNNTPVFTTELLTDCWNRSSIRVAADGAANYLHSLRTILPDHHVPDAVIGDLDSASKESLEYFKKFSKTCTIKKNPSQDSTDLMKCLDHLKTYPDSSEATVLLLGALGGPRFDHEMQNFNTAYMYQHNFERFVLISKDMIAEILVAGKHEVEIDKKILGPTCGLIPLFGSCQIKTTGLRWNLPVDDQSRGLLIFGGMVSTSNEILFDGKSDDNVVVEIETDHPMVWTVTMNESNHQPQQQQLQQVSSVSVSSASIGAPITPVPIVKKKSSPSPNVSTNPSPLPSKSKKSLSSPKSKKSSNLSMTTDESSSSPPSSSSIVFRVNGVPVNSGSVTGRDLVKLILAKVGDIQELSSLNDNNKNGIQEENMGVSTTVLSFRVKMNIASAEQVERVLRDPIVVDGQTVRVTLEDEKR